MKLFTFTGFMQVGKTTAANAIDAVRLSFAGDIKRIAMEDFGWDGHKDERGRKLLQNIGAMGRAYEPDIWIKKVDEQINRVCDDNPDTVFTLDDCRFVNEIAMLRKHGSLVIKILRHGYEGDGDITEQGVPDEYCDYIVSNDGTIEDLQNKIREIISKS